MSGKALVLTDGKAGHENQSKAFARALGLDFDLVEVRFKSRFAKALSFVLDWLGVRASCLFTGAEGLVSGKGKTYSAVIGTGSGTFYAAKVLSRRMGVRCGVVLYPRGYRLSSFDCVLAPAFDRPAAAPNVVPLPANLVANDAAFYDRGVAAFRERHPEKPEPVTAIGVIVGGPNKCSTLTAEWMRQELQRVFEEGRKTGGKVEFWVTTSRRTPPEVERVVEEFPFDYALIYSKDHFNPIPAFVRLARVLYVTAESTGMLSEACTFGGAEVRVLDNLLAGPHKFRRFVDDLRQAGYVDGCRKVDTTACFAVARQLMKV